MGMFIKCEMCYEMCFRTPQCSTEVIFFIPQTIHTPPGPFKGPVIFSVSSELSLYADRFVFCPCFEIPVSEISPI